MLVRLNGELGVPSNCTVLAVAGIANSDLTQGSSLDIGRYGKVRPKAANNTAAISSFFMTAISKCDREFSIRSLES